MLASQPNDIDDHLGAVLSTAGLRRAEQTRTRRPRTTEIAAATSRHSLIVSGVAVIVSVVGPLPRRQQCLHVHGERVHHGDGDHRRAATGLPARSPDTVATESGRGASHPSSTMGVTECRSLATSILSHDLDPKRVAVTCPSCGGTSRKPIAPDYYECTNVLVAQQPILNAQPGASRPVPFSCGRRYHETSTVGASAGNPPSCSCGTFAIGQCTHCGTPLCGDDRVHILAVNGHQWRCATCAGLWHREEQSRREAAELAEARRREQLPVMNVRQLAEYLAGHLDDWLDCKATGVTNGTLAQALAALSHPTSMEFGITEERWFGWKQDTEKTIGWAFHDDPIEDPDSPRYYRAIWVLQVDGYVDKCASFGRRGGHKPIVRRAKSPDDLPPIPMSKVRSIVMGAMKRSP